MYAIIYNLDGKVKDTFNGIYKESQFIYYTKGGLISQIPFTDKISQLHKFVYTVEHTIPCDYTRTYPANENERVAYYDFNGKDYIQKFLENMPVQSVPITVLDYITQWKAAQHQKEKQIQDPNTLELGKLLGYLFLIIFMVSAAWIAQTNASAATVNSRNLNTTLSNNGHLYNEQLNQTHQLYILYTTRCFGNTTTLTGVKA